MQSVHKLLGFFDLQHMRCFYARRFPFASQLFRFFLNKNKTYRYAEIPALKMLLSCETHRIEPYNIK
jgi:hypothetical protein